MSGESLSPKATLKVSSDSAVLLHTVEDRSFRISTGQSSNDSLQPQPIYSSVPVSVQGIAVTKAPRSPDQPPNDPEPPERRDWGRISRGFTTVIAMAIAAGMSAISANSISVESATQAESSKPQQRWDAHEVEVVLDNSLRPLGPHIQEVIEASFSTWSETGAALPVVRFVQGNGAVASLEPDGKSTILLAPIDFPGHESDLAITIGFSNPQNGEVSEADIVINSTHVFSSVPEVAVSASGKLAGSPYTPRDQESCAGSLDARACKSSYDLQNVMTHEVGHFFGLGENYDDTRATMFSCTSACETHKRDLATADLDSIVSLYESRAEEPVTSGCSGVQIGGNPVNPRLGLFTGWVLLLLLGLYRRRFA